MLLILPSPPPLSYWLPPLLSSGITAGIAILIIRRRPSRPATVLALYLLSASIWSFGYCLQLRSTTLAQQVFWSKVQYIGPAGVSLTGFLFVLFYAGLTDWFRTGRILALTTIPALTQILVWSNERHGLIWSRIWLDVNGPYVMLARTHGAWFWIFLSYSYGLIAISVLLLARELLNRRGIYRSQTFVLLLGCLVPLAGNLMYSFGMQPVPNLDLTTFGFSITGITMAWGLFQFQLPVIMPIARQRVFEGMRDAVIALDISGNIVDVNPEACRILNQSAASLIGRAANRVFNLYPDLAVFTANLAEMHGAIGITLSTVRRHFEVRRSPLLTQRERVIGSLIVLHDITEREAANVALRSAHSILEQRIVERTADLSQKVEELGRLKNQLTISANHDSLTGLANRKLFLDRVAQRLESLSTKPPALFAILYLDLDRFKIYNDGFGHHVGDLILVEMGRRLEGCLTPFDTAARLGGDEFAVLLENVDSVEDASRSAGQCLETLARPVRLAGMEVHLTASIGVAVSSDKGSGAEELVRDADLAMYRAKRAGGNQFVCFGQSMRSLARSLAQLEQDLRIALAHNQIIVQYQPFVQMFTGKVVGFEALVRWRHPERGVVLPAVFLPVAEQSGLLMAIDEFVLQEACRQKALWEELMPGGSPPPFVSVNISGWQFAHPHRWWNTLAALERPLAGLRLEIMESVLVDNARAAGAFFERIRSCDLKIYLDDFGTGYSSLSWLSQFPIHSLKIDRSFVKDLATDSRDLTIVRAIIALARSLGIETVAEGIECAQQSEMLMELGCEYGQGFHFSPAVDGELTFAMLK